MSVEKGDAYYHEGICCKYFSIFSIIASRKGVRRANVVVREGGFASISVKICVLAGEKGTTMAVTVEEILHSS